MEVRAKKIRTIKGPVAPKFGRHIEPNVCMRVLNGFPPFRLTSCPISHEYGILCITSRDKNSRMTLGSPSYPGNGDVHHLSAGVR